ncbi:MAG: 3-hydroxyacyl-ACP dehydratase FabZ, partial [Candidatus Kapaibacterium sp.]
AQILAARPGHAANIEFARKVRKHYLQKKALRRLQPKHANGIVMDINAIMKVMPHRYPFLLVDRIIEFDTEANRIVGYKNVTINEPFFPGHFPERPVMPGVLILESMAQCGCMLLLNLDGMSTENKLVFFMAINNAKFRKPVTPGDQLVLDVKMTARRFNTISLHADAYVGETLVAEADLSAAIVEKEA